MSRNLSRAGPHTHPVSRHRCRRETQSPDDGEALGSKKNPAPVGTTLGSGHWQVTVNSFDPDATQEVLAANSFNEKPAAGQQYALVNVTVKYTGEGSGSTYDLSFAYVTEGGNVVKSYDNDTLTPDPALDGEVYTGGTLTGNIDVTVPEKDNGLIRVQVGFSSNEMFFSTK